MQTPEIIFAHGAGAGSSSPWMQAWTQRLQTIGNVYPFDYPYMEAGRRAPDRMPKLLAAHRAKLESIDRNGPVILCGKSMGSRVGCHLSLDMPVDGLICMGYPLGRAGKPLRDQVLLDLRTPILFAQGSRDPLCQLDLMQDVCERMTAPNTLCVVEGGNHSLAVGKRMLKASGKTQEDHDERVFAAIQRFVTEVIGQP